MLAPIRCGLIYGIWRSSCRLSVDEIERPAPFFYSDVKIDSEMQLSVKIMDNIKKVKADLIAEIEKRVSDRILEQTNADLLIKLINNADSLDEAINIAALGTTYKRTGLHFDKRLEKMSNTIKYFKKNEKLSFHTDDDKPTHKLIIGDNYEALQNLLIQYRGKVNVIYIDPPYGKDSMGEFAATNYNNAITRDNLLSMLYPRLQLAKQLLSDDGVIFCSIDDRNQAYVKCLMDEVFGEGNFVAMFVWQKNFAPKNDNKYISISTDNILCFAKEIKCFTRNLLPRTEEQNESYSNPDNDDRGVWTSGSMLATTFSQSGVFEIIAPNGKTHLPPQGRCWRYSKQSLQALIDDNRIWWGNDGNNVPRVKRFLSEMPNGIVPQNLLLYKDVGSNQDGNKQMREIFDAQIFDFPKPIQLIKHFGIIATKPTSLILDFFAGSGTTGHAVLDLNKQDGGNRTFILCQLNEMTETTPKGIAYDVTSKRLKRVMTGECYDGTKDFKWLEKNDPYGGNLDVYEIGSVSNFEWTEGKTPFDVIDETLYGKEKFATVREKIEWVCGNFDKTQKYLEKLNEEE